MMDISLIFYIVLSLHGAIMVGAYFISVPVLFNLYIFDNLKVFQDDSPAVFSIIELCFALSSLIVFNVAYYFRDSTKRTDYARLNIEETEEDEIEKNKIEDEKKPRLDETTSKVLVFFYASFFAGSAAFSLLRMGTLGMLFSTAQTCADTAWDTGCPVTRYNSLSDYKISEKKQCMFLAYDDKNIETNGSTIDWSLKENYDASKRSQLLDRVNLNLNIDCVNNKCSVGTCNDGKCIVSENDLPKIHWCWYWGCDHVCNDRYVLNRTWLVLSIVNTIIYLTVTIFMIISIGSASRKKSIEEKAPPQVSESNGSDSYASKTIFL